MLANQWPHPPFPLTGPVVDRLREIHGELGAVIRHAERLAALCHPPVPALVLSEDPLVHGTWQQVITGGIVLPRLLEAQNHAVHTLGVRIGLELPLLNRSGVPITYEHPSESIRRA